MGFAAPDLDGWLGSAAFFLLCAEFLSLLDIEARLDELTHLGVDFCPGCLAQGLPSYAPPA